MSLERSRNNLNGRHDWSLVLRLLASSHFRTTNILVLSLLFTEHHFLLPSHAGNAFLLRFMFYQLLFGVVTHNKMRVPSFPFLARSSEGPATWLVKLRLFLPKITSAIMTRFTKPSALACVSEVFGP